MSRADAELAEDAMKGGAEVEAVSGKEGRKGELERRSSSTKRITLSSPSTSTLSACPQGSESCQTSQTPARTRWKTAEMLTSEEKDRRGVPSVVRPLPSLPSFVPLNRLLVSCFIIQFDDTARLSSEEQTFFRVRLSTAPASRRALVEFTLLLFWSPAATGPWLPPFRLQNHHDGPY